MEFENTDKMTKAQPIFCEGGKRGWILMHRRIVSVYIYVNYKK